MVSGIGYDLREWPEKEFRCHAIKWLQHRKRREIGAQRARINKCVRFFFIKTEDHLQYFRQYLKLHTVFRPRDIVGFE